MSPMREHDLLCDLMVKERCSGIGGSDWGHYLDLPTCRNCGKRCNCDTIRAVRADDAAIEGIRAELRKAEILVASVGSCAQCGQSWLEEACGPSHAAIWWVATHPVEAYAETMALREQIRVMKTEVL